MQLLQSKDRQHTIYLSTDFRVLLCAQQLSSEDVKRDRPHTMADEEVASLPAPPPKTAAESKTDDEADDNSSLEGVVSSPHLDNAKWNARNSFTADSPYYAAFCQGEFQSVNNLTSTLRDISNRTKTFCQTAHRMAEATQRLAQSCHLRRASDNDDGSTTVIVDNGDNSGSSSSSEMHPEKAQELRLQQRRKAVGAEMASLLGHLGEVRKKRGVGARFCCCVLLCVGQTSSFRDVSSHVVFL